MGSKDMVTKEYMADNRIFADAFNFLIYNGEQIIKPENLRPLDTTHVEIPFGTSGENVPIQKLRDELKALIIKEDSNAIYAVLGIENQSDIHYAMPVKDMNYDALEYANQVRKIANAHKKNNDKSSGAEYLSGFHKTDRLVPVVTLVIYFGADEWDGPKCIFDMFSENIDDKILAFTDNYKINLISPNEMSDQELDKLQTSLKEVIKYIKYSKDKNKINEIVVNDERFSKLERSAFNVINACTNSNLRINDNEEVVDMCQAILDMKQDARNEGMNEGIIKGMNEGINKGIIKVALNLLKVRKMSNEEISEVTGLSLKEIQDLILRNKEFFASITPSSETDSAGLLNS